MPDEDDLVAWLRGSGLFGASHLIGDDAAFLPESESWAVTVDSQIEGVHFVPGLDPAILAARLLAVNLSDLAAVGAEPAYAFLALAAPAGFDHRRFFEALARETKRWDVNLAGGDLATSPRLTAVMTLLGRRSPGGRWLRRDAAESGESLWLGGTVGESAAGAELVRRGARIDGESVRLPDGLAASEEVLAAARRAVTRHLLPRPQLALARWLAKTAGGAALDVSDGLARDLHRLCRESGVGAEVELDRIPLVPGFRELTVAIGRDGQDMALGGGEDYVLLFTLPEGDEAPPDCRRIGRVVPGREVHLIRDGVKTALPVLGWDHFQS